MDPIVQNPLPVYVLGDTVYSWKKRGPVDPTKIEIGKMIKRATGNDDFRKVPAEVPISFQRDECLIGSYVFMHREPTILGNNARGNEVGPEESGALKAERVLVSRW